MNFSGEYVVGEARSFPDTYNNACKTVESLVQGK